MVDRVSCGELAHIFASKPFEARLVEAAFCLASFKNSPIQKNRGAFDVNKALKSLDAFVSCGNWDELMASGDRQNYDWLFHSLSACRDRYVLSLAVSNIVNDVSARRDVMEFTFDDWLLVADRVFHGVEKWLAKEVGDGADAYGVYIRYLPEMARRVAKAGELAAGIVQALE